MVFAIPQITTIDFLSRINVNLQIEVHSPTDDMIYRTYGYISFL